MTRNDGATFRVERQRRPMLRCEACHNGDGAYKILFPRRTQDGEPVFFWDVFLCAECLKALRAALQAAEDAE